MGGLLGSLFISVNTQMGYCRKKVIKNNTMRIIETGLYGMATITLMSIIVIYATECEDKIPCTTCTGTTDEAKAAQAAYQ